MKALWNWQQNLKFKQASLAGKQRHYENVSIQEEGDVPTIHALMAQDRFVHMTPEIAQLYEVFIDDMPGNLSELHNEVDQWKAI